jgi:hypothetical protein
MREYHPLTHLKRPKCEGLAFTAKNRLHGAKQSSKGFADGCEGVNTSFPCITRACACAQ